VESRQLPFVFADNPQGSGAAKTEDGSEGRAYLLRTAKARDARDSTAPASGEGSLLERVASPSNLAEALLHVARNQGAPGEDGQSVEEVVEASPLLLPRLQRGLLTGSYRPGEILRVFIPKPGSRDRRALGIPNVVDRWVQEALRRELEPIFEPVFHPSSHGFRPGRGTRTAVAEAQEHVSAGYDWIVSLDLLKFFDRVHQQRLLSRLSHRVKDGRVLQLIHRILRSRVVMPTGERVVPSQGTPQGGPLSPLLSNVVLDELDWELDRRGLRFVRYADDVHVFLRSERSARRVFESLTRFVEGRLRLTVNREKSLVTRPEGVHLLGFCFHRKAGGGMEIHLSRQAKASLDAMIRVLTPRNWGRSISACLARVNVYLRGWLGYFQLCTTEGATLFGRFDAHIRRRIRAIVIRQKKRGRPLYRHLRSRGVRPGAAAKAAWSQHGIWARSNSYGLTRAYPNAWFAERLVSLWAEWHQRVASATASRQLSLFELTGISPKEPDVWSTSPVL
jgi:group II intron reverse transcriptase/maturase